LNYVFLDTIDDSFIERIADKICPFLAEKLTRDYMDKIMQPHGFVDYKKLEKYIEVEGMNIAFLNCYYILDKPPCSETDCFYNHKVVLAPDQSKIFNDKFNKLTRSDKDSIYSSVVPNNDELHDKAGLEITLQRVRGVNKFGVETMDIPASCSKKNKDYLPTYYREAQRFSRKEEVKDLFYVRADTVNSHYEKFRAETGLAVEPCDRISRVV